MESANIENQHSDFAWNQQKKPLLKRGRNCLNIIVFFQWDKRSGNVAETKSFPFMYLIHTFSNTSYSPHCLCALPACFPEIFGSPSLLGRLAHSVHLFHSPLCTSAFSLTLLLRKLLSAACTNHLSFTEWFATQCC